MRHFWAREPESELRPLLLTRLNAFIGKDLKRSGAFLVGFYRKGLTETDDPLYSHRLRFANTSRLLSLLDGGRAGARRRARRPRRAARGAPAGLVRRDDAAREGAVPGDLHVPGGLPPAHAGRPHADGPLHRGALPVPRLPRRRARRGAPRPAAAARADREVPAAEGGGAPAPGRDRRPQEAALPRADRGRLRRPRRSGLRRASSSTSGASPTPGCFSPEAVARLVRKCEAGAPRDAVSRDRRDGARRRPLRHAPPRPLRGEPAPRRSRSSPTASSSGDEVRVPRASAPAAA